MCTAGPTSENQFRQSTTSTTKNQQSHDHVKRCRKTLHKMQHPLMTKTLSELEIEGNLLHLIKKLYRNYSFTVTHSKPSHYAQAQGIDLALTAPFRPVLEAPANAMRQAAGKGGVMTGKEDKTLCSQMNDALFRAKRTNQKNPGNQKAITARLPDTWSLGKNLSPSHTAAMNK